MLVNAAFIDSLTLLKIPAPKLPDDLSASERTKAIYKMGKQKKLILEFQEALFPEFTDFSG